MALLVRCSFDAHGELHKKNMVEASTKCPLCEASAASHFMRTTDRFHWRSDEYDLMRCSSCSCVWLANPPRPEEMPFHYDEDYHKVIMAGGEMSATRRWQSQRENIARHKQRGSILDIGCSSGGFLGTMKGGSWNLYGIEMEALTAEKARQATGAEIFVGEALDAPFPAESFDVITCFDVLEHVYHPRQFLTKVLEWLKPGGIFCAGLPNIESWEARALGTYWYGLELPRHLFHFSPRSLRYVMTSLGFQEISIATPGTSYLERSGSYLCSEALQRIGIAPRPMAKDGQRSLPARVVRKALRTVLIAPFGQLASSVGAGASMEVIFAKSVSHSDSDQPDRTGQTRQPAQTAQTALVSAGGGGSHGA
jgi:SAM-dependent methyltransferase